MTDKAFSALIPIGQLYIFCDILHSSAFIVCLFYIVSWRKTHESTRHAGCIHAVMSDGVEGGSFSSAAAAAAALSLFTDRLAFFLGGAEAAGAYSAVF